MSSCLLCTCLTATTTEQCLAQMSAAAEKSDLFEIRLDYNEQPDLGRLLDDPPKPVIATNRPEREGGRYKGNENNRIAVLKEASELGADYIDIELDSVSLLGDIGRSKLIVSYHNFDETPDDLDSIHKQIVESGADIAKLATLARDISDNERMFRLLLRSQVPTIGLCMGELGLISRILAPRYGSVLTFAAVGEGRESAPGQLTADELTSLYGLKRIDRDTEIYGVIGNPIGHSMSPHIHNAAFQQLDMNRVYVPFLVDEVTEFLASFKDLGVMGCSVTIPHKETCMESLDEVDPIARRIGAVNTIAHQNGKLYGCNTDWRAAVDSIEEELQRREEGKNPLREKQVALIGAGGAARAIGFGIVERGGELLIVNRTEERARRLAEELECASMPLKNFLESDVNADVIINSSSVGMSPNDQQTPVPKTLLKPKMVVFDAVYNPIRTRLIREAEEVGCPTITGFEMFVRQAAAQFELWTEMDAPRELMASVVRQRLEGV